MYVTKNKQVSVIATKICYILHQKWLAAYVWKMARGVSTLIETYQQMDGPTIQSVCEMIPQITWNMPHYR